MKTKHTLTILGVYNILFGLIAMFASTTMAGAFVNSKNIEVFRMGELFHIGLGHAIFLVGLTLIFAKNAELDAAKKHHPCLHCWYYYSFLYLFRNYGTRTTNFI